MYCVDIVDVDMFYSRMNMHLVQVMMSCRIESPMNVLDFGVIFGCCRDEWTSRGRKAKANDTCRQCKSQQEDGSTNLSLLYLTFILDQLIIVHGGHHVGVNTEYLNDWSATFMSVSRESLPESFSHG